VDDFIKPDAPYMNHAEAELFKRLRARGEITFFGCDVCDACPAEVPKGKRFCSKKCYGDYEKGCIAVAEFFHNLNRED